MRRERWSLSGGVGCNRGLNSALGFHTLLAPRASDRNARGQALLEMVFILPFILILIMAVSEFGIYFYRANVVENTAQTMGRMAARGATSAAIAAFMTSQMSKLSPTMTVKSSTGSAITSWASDQQIELSVTAIGSVVMPIGVLNTFGGGAAIFPSSFTFKSTRTIYVE